MEKGLICFFFWEGCWGIEKGNEIFAIEAKIGNVSLGRLEGGGVIAN